MEIEVEPLLGGHHAASHRGAGVCLVARSGPSEVGHVRIRWRTGQDAAGSGRRPVAYLEDLWVAPEERSRGTGSRLVAAAEKLSHELGAGRLELRVARSNHRARSLYERLGFVELGPADTHIAGSYIGDDGQPHRWRGEWLTLAKDLSAGSTGAAGHAGRAG